MLTLLHFCEHLTWTEIAPLLFLACCGALYVGILSHL